MYSSLLYSSTGVHKTEESVWGLILRKEANVRVTLCNYYVLSGVMVRYLVNKVRLFSFWFARNIESSSILYYSTTVLILLISE